MPAKAGREWEGTGDWGLVEAGRGEGGVGRERRDTGREAGATSEWAD